jgi:hypothetical protein
MDRASVLLEQRLDAVEADALAESVLRGRMGARDERAALAELACRVLVDEADAAGRPAPRRAVRLALAALKWGLPLAFALRIAAMIGAFN